MKKLKPVVVINADKKKVDKVPGKAWMLGYDGQAIPITTHVYGAPGDLSSNMVVAMFLMKYKPSETARSFLRGLLGYIANNEIVYTEDESAFFESLREALIEGYVDMEEERIKNAVQLSREAAVANIMSYISGMSMDEVYDLDNGAFDEHSGDNIMMDLNQDFIRVRLDNEYNADYEFFNEKTGKMEKVEIKPTGVCYFRIGSVNRDWRNQIWTFVYEHGAVKSVIVERDPESDKGTMNRKGDRNVMINDVPRDEFLGMDRLPFLGSKSLGFLPIEICRILDDGGSYSDIFKIKANASRIAEEFERLRKREIKSNYVKINPEWATTRR